MKRSVLMFGRAFLFFCFVMVFIGFPKKPVFSQNFKAQLSHGDSTEIMNTLNSSIDRLDSAISNITSQMEEENHNQKKANTNTANIIKDMKQQIKDLQKANEKITYILSVQKVEIENLKNITSMYADNQKKLEEQIASIRQGMVQPKLSEQGKSFVDSKFLPNEQKNVRKGISEPEIIEEEQLVAFGSGDAKGDDYFETSSVDSVATSNPSDLLLNPNTMNAEVIEDEKSVDNQQPYTDEETFEMAMNTYKSKNYTDSAIQFAANIKAFPKGKNFYKNLLYLGNSMKNLDNKVGACTAYAKIIHSKENIESKVMEDAEKGFAKLKCNK